MISTVEYNFAEFRFVPETQELFRNGLLIAIPPKQADLLTLFLRNPTKLLSRQRIKDEVWGDTVVEFDQSLNFAIKGLRQVLGDNSQSPMFIETIPRKGYRFKVTPRITSEEDINSLSNTKDTNRSAWILGAAFGLAATLSFSLWFSGIGQSTNSPQETVTSEVNSTFKRALYLFEKAETNAFKNSTSLFVKHIEQYPRDGVAHALLAIALIKSKQSADEQELALMHIESAELHAPNSPETKLARAQYYFYIDWDVKRALKLTEEVVETRPEWVLAQHELAVLQVISNERNAAVKTIEALLQLAPGIALERFHAGWFYQLNQQYQESLIQYQRSLEINQQQPLTHLFAALVTQELNMLSHTKQYLRSFIELINADKESNVELFNAVDSGNFSFVYQWWQSWLSQHQAPYFLQAIAYGITKDRIATLQAVEKAIENKENMVPTLLAFSQFAFLHDDPDFIKLTSVIQR